MVYLFILLYLLALVYHYDYRNNKRNWSVHYLFVLIILVLVAGLRYRLGVDSIRYASAYSTIPTLNTLSIRDFSEQKYDPLYLLLASFCRSISSEFWLLQMAQALLVNTVFFRFFRNNTKKVFTAVLFYFCVLYFSNMAETMRESCAISMMLIAWEYYKKNLKWKVLFFFILAFLFHSSAIILFLVFLPICFRFDKYIRFSKLLFLVSLVILVLASAVQKLFMDNILLLSLSSQLEDKINLYAEAGYFEDRINVFGIMSNLLLYGLIPFICAKNLRIRKDSYKLEFFLCVELICASLCFPIYIFYRYVNYFLPFVIIAICRALSFDRVKILGVFSIKTTKLLIWVLLVSPYILIQAKQMFSREWPSGPHKYSRYYPYSSILDKKRNQDREEIITFYLY